MNIPNVVRSHATSTVISFAGLLASEMHSDVICTEHLMLSLCQDHDTVIVLNKLVGLDNVKIWKTIIKEVGEVVPRKSYGQMRLTPRSQKVIGLAGRIAKHEFGLDHIEPWHLFLGILYEGDGLAAQVLKKLKINYKETLAKFPKEGLR
jgi:ATP-dependent Clp protease ATP-binding subunit ClpC